jgi:hypothetical protein
MEHAEVLGRDEGGRATAGAGRLPLGRGVAKGTVACWAVGEGGCCAAQDQLLGLRVADDNGIVMAARETLSISTVPCLVLPIERP